jgi:hypothetical protein
MRKSFETAIEIFKDSNGILRSSEARRRGINPHTLWDMVRKEKNHALNTRRLTSFG